MNPNDDYLWDGSGPPDPEVQRLEKLLGRFRYQEPVAKPKPRHHRRWLAVAAGLILAAGLAYWFRTSQAPGWQIASVEGAPLVGSRSLRGGDRLRVGQWLETDAISRAQIEVPGLGTVDVEPNTRIALKRTQETEHRMALERGTLHAFILAPPRLFLLETPSALAVDLGCAYTMTVDEKGHGLLHVTIGYVALENPGREAIVPSHAFCETRPGQGHGTPYAESAKEGFREALRSLDFDSPGLAALQSVLDRATAEDDVSLWHLARNGQPEWQQKVHTRMGQLGLDPRGYRHWQHLMRKP